MRRKQRFFAPSVRAIPASEQLEPRLLLNASPVLAQIDALGFGAENGTINPPSATGQPDVDVYEYVAPVTQTLDIRVQVMGTLESATLSIFSQSGQLLLSAPGEVDQVTEVRFAVVAGTTYYVDVAAGANSLPRGLSGPYRLVFADFSNQQANAYQLTPPPGSVVVDQAGAIDPAGDVDWFKVTAPFTGLLTADLATPTGGGLEGKLLVEDTSGAHFVTDDGAASGSSDSRVSGFQVISGHTYYIQVAASSVAIEQDVGQYRLSLSFAPLIAGHSFTAATPLAVAPTGAAGQNGIITTAGVADYYLYVAPQSTDVVIREEAPGPGALDTLLNVYDEARNPIPGGTSYDAQWFDQEDNYQVGSEVRVPVVANRSYYIEAGGFGASTGNYDLTVTPDGAAESFATATPLTLSPSGALVAAGLIFYPGDVQFYQFVAPVSGAMTIQQDAVGSGLDSFLTIYDASQHVITFNDDSDPGKSGTNTGNYQNSLVQFSVVAGQTYFVEAAAYPNLDGSGAAGGFELVFATNANPPADNKPDTFAKAEPVDISSDYARLTGSINSDTELNDFQFVAPRTESVEVDLESAAPAPNQFQGYLFAYDDAGNQVADDYNLSLLENDTSSIVQFNVVAGESYFVQVAAYIGRIGSYDLRFEAGPPLPPSAAGVGTTFATATVLTLDAADTATVAGTIDEPGGVNVFEFRADTTETMTVRMFAAPGSRLDTFLIAFSESQTETPDGDDDDTDTTLNADGTLENVIDRNSVIELSVHAGKMYYLKAASAGSSTGAYFLALSPVKAEFGDQIGDISTGNFRNLVVPVFVHSIPLDASGAGTQDGTLVMPGDLDAFQFRAPLTGLATIQEVAAPGSSLDTQLFAFDSSREPLASNNDFDGTYNSEVLFNVAAGQVYYLKAAGYGASFGAYVLSLAITPPNSAGPGKSFATATFLTVSASNPTIENGAIVAAGDATVYQFFAPASGSITVQEQATPGSPLDSYLYAYDGSQPVNNFDGLFALIASDDDSQGTLNSLVQFNVTANQLYYLRAAGFETSIGKFVLTISYGGAASPSQAGHTFADAGTITLDSTGYGSQTGIITSPGDVDMYRFVAPYTGAITIRQDAPSAGTRADKGSPSKSILDSVLTVFNDSDAEIAYDDDDIPVGTPTSKDDPLNSKLVVSIVAGQTYYVQAAGDDATTGRYELLFNDDVPNDFADASLITVDSKLLSATVFGTIEVPDDVDVYRFVAPVTGPIMVTQQAAGSSRLDSYLFLFGQSETLLASDDDETVDPTAPGGGVSIPDSLVEANVVQGQTYYIRAASSQAHLSDSNLSATGAYRLQLTFPAYDFGETFADARTIPPPGPKSATQNGDILQIGEVDMFQFAAAFSGFVTFHVGANPQTAQQLIPILVAYNAQGTELARGSSEILLGVQPQSLYFIQVGGYGVSTGGIQLSYSEINGRGRGVDFGSAISIGLSKAGSAVQSGVLGPIPGLNVFEFVAPFSGQETVSEGAGSVGILAGFTYSNGIPTQVGAETTNPGVMTFDVTASQTYFVRVSSTGQGGGYELEFETTAERALPSNIQLPGKFAFVQLGASYTAAIPVTALNPAAEELTAGEITAALVAAFVASQHGHLAGPYLLVWTDPIDFILIDPKARESGYTAGRGAISEVGGSYNSGPGALKMDVMPYAIGAYELTLLGTGDGPVLFGAALITESGASVAPDSTQGIALPIALESMTDLVVVLDFRSEDSSGSARAGDPGSSPLSSAATAASSSPSAVNPFSPPIVAESGGGQETSGGLEAAVAVPANVATPFGQSASNASAVSEILHTDTTVSPPPNRPGQAAAANRINLPGELERGLRSLGAGVQVIVQSLFPGVNTLAGWLRRMLSSIFTGLSLPRAASPTVGIRSGVVNRPADGEVCLAALHLDLQGCGVKPWEQVLQTSGEDRLPASILEPARLPFSRDRKAELTIAIVALTAICVRGVQMRRINPPRILCCDRSAPGRHAMPEFSNRRAKFCGIRGQHSVAP
jgi:hypothetical protein